MEVDSVLLEGRRAPSTGRRWRRASCNKVQAYMAPKLFGGPGAPSPRWGARAWPHPDQARPPGNTTVTRLGEDFLLESEVDWPMFTGIVEEMGTITRHPAGRPLVPC